MQICWAVLNKEIRRENPIYRPPVTKSVFKPVRGRSGKPRTITLEEYYARYENSHSERDFQNPRFNGGD